MYYSNYYILTIECNCLYTGKKGQDAMPQTLKTKKNNLVHLKEEKNNIAQKQNNLKRKVAHVEIRLTRRMIILYPLSWSQRKYNNSEM